MSFSPPSCCPCCEGTTWNRRWSGFMICHGCGLMAVEGTFSNDQLRSYYQEDYFHGSEYIDYVADEAAQKRTLGQHLKVVRRFVPRGGRMLEIGCAYGFFLELIQDEYPSSVGLDIFSAGVARAKDRGFDARDGNLLEMNIEERFDGICLWDTIEHLPQPFEFIERARQLLKPGGYCFLTTGDFGALLPRLQGLKWRQIHPPTHLFYFTRPSLRALCHRAGLQAVQFGTVSVHRRVGSALQALSRFRKDTMAGRMASVAERCLPKRVLDSCFATNLGDTLYLVAQKPQLPIRRRGQAASTATVRGLPTHRQEDRGAPGCAASAAPWYCYGIKNT